MTDISWADAVAAMGQYFAQNELFDEWPIALTPQGVAALQCANLGGAIIKGVQWHALTNELILACDRGNLSAPATSVESPMSLIEPHAFAQWLLQRNQAPSKYILAWFANARSTRSHEIDRAWPSVSTAGVDYAAAAELPSMSAVMVHPAQQGSPGLAQRNNEDGPTFTLDSAGKPLQIPKQQHDVLPIAVTRSNAQDAAILAQIRLRGIDPLAIPKFKHGQPGIKSTVRQALVGVDRHFPRTGRQFPKAWERLRQRKEIRDQE